MEVATHTGDKAVHHSWDERFEHPARTWASASHRSFTLQAVGVAMVNSTYKFARAESKKVLRQAMGEMAATKVENAVPPTLEAGAWCERSDLEASEGEGEWSDCSNEIYDEG